MEKAAAIVVVSGTAAILSWILFVQVLNIETQFAAQLSLLLGAVVTVAIIIWLRHNKNEEESA